MWRCRWWCWMLMMIVMGSYYHINNIFYDDDSDAAADDDMLLLMMIYFCLLPHLQSFFIEPTLICSSLILLTGPESRQVSINKTVYISFKEHSPMKNNTECYGQ